MALARMSRRLRPRPSSATCTVTTWPRRATVSVMVPARGLPTRFAFVGRFEAVVDGIAQDVQQRVDNWFSTSASTRMSWPTTTSEACL